MTLAGKNLSWSFCVAILGAIGSSLAEGADKPNRPNILLIVSEDNGPELGCYGDPYVKTPNLDRLAAGGFHFQRAYVPQAGCSQSRAALLTGLFPHQNGQVGLATWNFRMYHEDTPNIVRSLKNAGYRTGILGKLHVNPSSSFPFDFSRGASNFGRKDLHSYAAEAKQFFVASDAPFFLSVNYPDAHRPFLRQVDGIPSSPLSAADVRPLSYLGLDTPELREQTANYYNCLSRLDTLIGDLLAALRESGKFEDTLIVYLGDHGADLLRGKRTSYEGGVRIPLTLHWKSRWKGAESGRAELVSTLDLMPTLLAAAGAEPVPDLPGRSLLPLLDGKSDAWRRYLFTEFHTHSAHEYYPQRTVRDERFKLTQNLMPGETNPGYDHTLDKFFTDVRAGIERAEEPVRSAYQLMRRPPAFELYDLQADPYEFRNLADDPKHQETLHRLRNELQQWRTKTHDPLVHAPNVTRLKQEIDACFVDGEAHKDRLSLTYPEYFFQPQESPEGRLESFLGDAKLEVQQVTGDERFPNIVVTHKGTVLVTWGKTHVRARRSEDGGKTWGDEITITNPGFHGGGTTVDETTGDILAFVEEHHPPAKLTMFRSTDDGKTWTAESSKVQPDSRGNLPSMHMNEHGITLQHGEHRGRLLRPSRFYGKKNTRSEWPQHYTNAVYSDDGGRTWRTSEPFPENGTGEAAVVELSDGRIYYNSRSHWEELPNHTRRREAWSTDGGETWKDRRTINALPDGNQHNSYGCMGGLTRLLIQGKDILIFSNIDTPKTQRERATVWASFDGGKTWPVKRLVDAGPSAYSSLTSGRPHTPSAGWIYVHYETNGSSKVARFNLSWILRGDTTGDGTIPSWVTVAPSTK